MSENNNNTMSSMLDSLEILAESPDDGRIVLAFGDLPQQLDTWLTGAETTLSEVDTTLGDLTELREDIEEAVEAAGDAKTNAEALASNAEAWAAGTRGGIDVDAEDAAYHNNAKYYVDQISGDADAAAASATAAAASATAAAGSESNAADSADEAASSAASATASATAASASQTSAANSATAAAASQEAAAASATAASTAAIAASGSSISADSSRREAISAAADAQSAANEASSSQAAAESARDAAVTAKNTAVTAKDDAVAAKTAAESAQTAAAASQTAAASSATSASDSAASASSSATSASGSASAAAASASAAAQSAQDAEDVLDSIPPDYTTTVQEVTGLKSAVEQLDNNVITDSAGPSPIVSIADGADGMPMRSVEVAIEPVQDLHGYDAPWPAGGGKNLLNWENTTTTIRGVEFTVNADGTVNVNGTASGGDASFYSVAGYNVPFKAGSYILSGCPSGGSQPTYLLNETKKASSDYGNGVTFTLSEDQNIQVRIVVRDGVTVNNLLFKPMIRLASETDATFAPYSNICPITGWTGAKVTRTGKNLFDETQYQNLMTTYEYLSGSYRCKKIQLAPNTAYTISQRAGAADSNGLILLNNVAQVNNSGFFDCRTASATKTYTTDSSGCLYIGCYTNNDAIYNTRLALCKIQIENGSQATDYQAYTAQSVTIPLGQTVYGGTLDAVAGTLTIDKVVVDLGSLTWAYVQSLDLFSSNSNSPSGVSDNKAFLCSMYKYVGSFSALVDKSCANVYNNRIAVRDSAYEGDATTFKTAMNGVQLVYELATPVEVTLTGQELETLKGVNNVFSDSGDVAITYPADTKLYIDKKIAELQALILENNG